MHNLTVEGGGGPGGGGGGGAPAGGTGGPDVRPKVDGRDSDNSCTVSNLCCIPVAPPTEGSLRYVYK